MLFIIQANNKVQLKFKVKYVYFWAFFIHIGLFFAGGAFAQQGVIAGGGLALHGGRVFIYNHPIDSIAHFSPAIQGDLYFRPKAQAYWQQALHNPKYGISFFASYSGTDYIGYLFGSQLFIEPYLLKTKHWGISLRAGAGAVYCTHIYDSVTNPVNNLISLPVSFSLQGKAAINYFITPNFSTGIRASFNHISNGALKLPNWGLNTPMIGVECSYFPQPTQAPRLEKPPFPRQIQLYAHAGAGIRQYRKGGTPPKTLMWDFTLALHKQLSPLSALQAGVSYFGASPWRDNPYMFNPDPNATPLDMSKVYTMAAFLGYEMRAGQISLLIQGGPYFKDPYNLYKKIFQRYLLRWYPNRFMFIHVGLKAHASVAEFAELGAGFCIGKAYKGLKRTK